MTNNAAGLTALDLSQWEMARFGYFDHHGTFVEFTGEDTELPNDSSPRWVGGPHDMQLLRAAIAPAEPTVAPDADFTDSARGALLWVLWHHQGATSAVGQAMRFALGMDAHAELTEWHLRQAKSWGTGIPGLAHQVATLPTAPHAQPPIAGEPVATPKDASRMQTLRQGHPRLELRYWTGQWWEPLYGEKVNEFLDILGGSAK
jgi:hypothetical protein